MAKTRTTINISLPAALGRFVRQRMAGKGFENTSEYFRQLIREDQRRAEDERLESLLLEGLASGKPEPATDQWWEERFRRLASGARRRKSA
jgi:antitoxin ParD1/3/4